MEIALLPVLPGLGYVGAADPASEVPQPGEEPLRQVRGDPAAGRRVCRQRLHPEDTQEDGLDFVLVRGLARVVLGFAEPVDVHPQVQRFFHTLCKLRIDIAAKENRRSRAGLC